MFKNYLISQLTQISAYLGVFLMICALLHVSYFVIFLSGLALLLTDDVWCQKKMGEISPAIKKALGQ